VVLEDDGVLRPPEHIRFAADRDEVADERARSAHAAATARAISAKSSGGSSCTFPWNARCQLALGHLRTNRSFGTSDAAFTPRSGATARSFFVRTRQGY